MHTQDLGSRVIIHLGSRKSSDLGDDLRGLAVLHKGRVLELDMAAVQVLNADAVSGLIFLHAQMSRDGGKLLLSNVDVFVRAIFRVTKTDSVFEIVGEGSKPVPVVG